MDGYRYGYGYGGVEWYCSFDGKTMMVERKE